MADVTKDKKKKSNKDTWNKVMGMSIASAKAKKPKKDLDKEPK
jgi:hypothetical protein